MSGMAELLAKAGYCISGSDLEENDRTVFLKKMGLEIYIGHDKDNVLDANLVVFSSAVNHDNIEIRKAKKLGIPVMRREIKKIAKPNAAEEIANQILGAC